MDFSFTFYLISY